MAKKRFFIVVSFQPGYAHGLGSLQFPNGSSPVVSRMSVYTGNNLAESRSPALPLSCYHNHLYMERAEVLRERLHTTGLRLHLFTEGMLPTVRLLINSLESINLLFVLYFVVYVCYDPFTYCVSWHVI
jgi:hypothetical protein